MFRGSFSDRHGHVSFDPQEEGLKERTKNQIWNVIKNPINEKLDNVVYVKVEEKRFFEAYWSRYKGRTLDEIPVNSEALIAEVKESVTNGERHEVFSLIELAVRENVLAEKHVEELNDVLEREVVPFRVAQEKVVPITNEAELASIEDAIEGSTPFSGVEDHLTQALDHLADRNDPDYRNSIKESISAVESLCKQIAGVDGAALSDALKVLEEQMNLHGALRKSFEALYGYTSDADGIRHGMLEKSTVTFSDAKYVLVVCSGFVNYLIAKVGELGIDIPNGK
jgi:hypothetical protein